ncbi:pyridoxamine kinase [Streptococcus catagoni]|uniref:pyridoxamine kinase n=1 Tax=Streptococcus catagoni TaxID=2654874 RepID=UPI00140CF51B|nr:pyridoxamine kinase [Streptococcus catagoni]
MNKKTKSLIVANDLAGLGKVALTSSLPLMSACQISVKPLPTVLLSSHTGDFQEIYCRVLEEEMLGFLRQWTSLNFRVDGVLTGYFKSKEQLRSLKKYATDQDLPLFVDPIMADKGKLYQGFDKDFPIEMRRFCKGVDVIIPNLTEAAFLSGLPYPGEKYQKRDIEGILSELAKLDNKHILITGLSLEEDRIGLAYFNRNQKRVSYHMAKAYPFHFYGTGDLLTAILAAGYFHDLSFEDTIPLALRFLDKSLEETLALGEELRYGIAYEGQLLDLMVGFQHLLERKNEKITD